MEEEKPEEISPKFENKAEDVGSAIKSDSKSSMSSATFSDREDVNQSNENHDNGVIKHSKQLQQDVVSKDNEERPKKALESNSFISGTTLVRTDSDDSFGKTQNKNVPEIDGNDKTLIDSRPSSRLSFSSDVINGDEINKPTNTIQHDGPELVKIGDREASFITRSGGETIELSTVCTQTDNSWLKDIDLYEEILLRRPEWIDELRKTKKKSKSLSERQTLTHRKKKSVSKSRTSSSASLDANDHNENLEQGDREPSVQQSRQSFVSPLPQTPIDINEGDILYRSPTVEMLSSSSSEDEEEYSSPDDQVLIPSIGPPAILQYFKESQHPPLNNENIDKENVSGKEFLKKSLFTGPCMFCKNEVLPFPTEEELADNEISPEDLFCCPDYERFIKFELSQRGDQSHVRDEMIDIKPHPPFGTKAARKAAKERAIERARQREMERQKVAGANSTNFYALTRQMKTITYSLASTKCMEEGWTVKPLTPAPSDSDNLVDPFVIEVNPIQQLKRAFLERFYENGQRFLIILPDGSGCCYYPSGNIAVIITTTEKGKFTYLAFEDDYDYDVNKSGMLAVFDPSGHGTCYFRNGIVRLVLDPYGGVLLDARGERKKKWLWRNLKTHVHAPPFQPITFSITKQLSVRCLSQDKVILTYNHGKYTAKFNVGSKLKAVRSARPPLDRDDHEIHLAEVKQFINIVLDRTQNALRLPKYSRLDKIPLPHRLQKTKDTQRSRLKTMRTPSQADTSTTVTVN